MRIRSIIALCLLSCGAPAVAAMCPPAGWTMESLSALKQTGFEVVDANQRATLQSALLDCLGSADPELRDGIAFEALSTWLRKGDMSPSQLRDVRDSLYRLLERSDRDGLQTPFAALVLSEVARTDRIKPWMTPAERATMLMRAVAYIEGVRDYRGFDDRQGWRHGVAHGADWLMQLALNPALDTPQLLRIADAVAMQAVPLAPHAYVFGEPGRLARPLLFVAQRGVRDEAAWTAWFATLVTKLGDKDQVWRDSGALARRHDLSSFLQALYVEADVSTDARLKVLLPGIVAALKALP